MARISRFGLDVIYGLYKENRAKLNQLEDETFYQLEVEDSLGYYYKLDEVYYKSRSDIRMLYEKKILYYGKNIKRHINGFMEIFQIIFFHNNMANPIIIKN